MKRLIPITILILITSYLVSQTLHQAESFTFDVNNPVPTGDHIFEAVEFVEFLNGSEYNPVPGESLEARINPYWLPPPPGPITGGPGQDDDGVVGTLNGILSINPLGAAVYQIPLDIPTGTCGMQPKLTLSYNSQVGNGYMGVGWNIIGLSSITRSGNTNYLDGFVDDVDFINDKFAIDGNRLIVINSLTYGSDGAEYRTEINSFSKILSHGGTFYGPQWFEVWTKDGLRVEYGNTADSRIEAPGCYYAIAYLISKVTDHQGNYMTFEYLENDDMTMAISKITYTGNSSTYPVIEPYYEILFTYEDRPDPRTNYFAGSFINVKKRLSTIEIVYAPSTTTYKKYTIRYSYDNSQPINDIYHYYSHVTEIEVSDPSDHLNPTRFQWGEESQNPFITYSTSPTPNEQLYCGDYNGDGKTDIIKVLFYYDSGHNIHFDKWELYLANSSGTGFSQSPDFVWYLPTEGIKCFTVGDFNGDGLSDFMVGYDSPWEEDPPDHDHIWVHLAKAGTTGFEGFDNPKIITSYNLDVDHRIREIQTGDINGDGLDDIAIKISHKSDPVPSMDDHFSCDVLFSVLLPDNDFDFIRKGWVGGINRFYLDNFISRQTKDLLFFKETYCKYYFWDDELKNFYTGTENFGYPTKYH